jgi:thiamine biosynthesis lipoprotein ApbE
MAGTAVAPPPLAGASWTALGTLVVLRVLDPAALETSRAAVEAELDAIDRACSRFRPDSELSRLNAARGRSMTVSPLLVEALEQGLRAAELTDGDVDPTIGRALELCGYDRDWDLLASPADPGAEQAGPRAPRVLARMRSGWRSVTLERSAGTVRVPDGMTLDLGATAKAWAADRSAAAAAAAAGCPVLVSIGGDISTAAGAPAGGWALHVTDDHRSDVTAPGQTVRIGAGAVATSSTAVRRWRHEGSTMHHIIDPATGWPVQNTWRTVSVAAATCTDANIATTAALVRGGRAPSWLAGLGLPARLVAWSGAVTSVGGWPAEGS